MQHIDTMMNRLSKITGCMNGTGPTLGQFVFTVAALAIVLVSIYANSFQASWHYDDFTNIVENNNIHLHDLSWNEFKQVFYKNRPEKVMNNRPVAYLTFAINYYFSGLHVFSYHLVNLFIHALCSIVLYLFIYRTLNLPVVKTRYSFNAHAVSLVSVWLWATHPIQVTAVTYIVQRMASMAGLFYILSMYGYLRARTAETARIRFTWYAWCCISGVLSFMTKENAAMLPFTIFIYERFLIQPEFNTKRIWNRLLKPIVLPVLIVLVLAFLYTDPLSVLSGYDNRPFTPIDRLMTQPRVILFYISLLIYPTSSRLALLHDIEFSTGMLSPWTTLPSMVMLTGIVLFFILLAKKHPLISFSGLFFFLNHLIEGSIFNLELIYEHRNYLPSMLFFVPVGLFLLKALDYFTHNKLITIMIYSSMTVILISNGHSVYFRNQVFLNEGTLWQDNAAKSHGMSVVHTNLGKFYWNIEQPEDAAKEYKKALSLNHFMNLKQPGIVHFNLGLYYSYIIEDHQQALFHFTTALDHADGIPKLWAETARTNLILGDRQKASEQIQFALQFWPGHPDLLTGLSLIQYKSGDILQARHTALYLHHFNMAESAESNGQPMKDFSGVLPLLGEIARKKGDTATAIEYWEMLMRKQPQHIRGTLALIELYHEVENNTELCRMVGKLMFLRKNKGVVDTIKDARQPEGIKAYLPDAETILPAIQECLAGEAAQAVVE